MDPSLARREALRIFRLVLIVQLILMGLSFLAVLSLGGAARWGFFLRAAPVALVTLPARVVSDSSKPTSSAILGVMTLIRAPVSRAIFGWAGKPCRISTGGRIKRPR